MPGTEVVPADVTELAPAPPSEAVELRTGRSEVETMLRGALAQLDELVALHATDVEGQARTFALVARLTSDLKALQDAVIGNLVQHMAAKRIAVDGVGMFERRTVTANSKWDHDAVWHTIRAAAADTGERVNPETGELEDEADAVVRIARELQTPGAWRKTALRARGLDPEEISEQTWGKQTVQFTAAGGGKK